MNINDPVFIWRTSKPSRHHGYSTCQYCSTSTASSYCYFDDKQKLETIGLDAEQMETLKELTALPEECLDQKLHCGFGRGSCRKCGWWYKFLITNSGGNATSVAEMLAFDINDTALLANELCSHLARRYSDIYQLSPRRFEEAVAEVYRSMGWQVTLTAQTRDGGLDLCCLANDKNEKCIVECKRYSAERTVGIAVVDRLVGVSIRTGSNSAHLVTSSSFSRPALQAAAEARKQGITLELTDASELLRLLEVYSDPTITVNDLRLAFTG